MTPPENTSCQDYDVAVIGAGIAGMESALTLGDMGYRVLLVEKESSVGGRTILLSKVFPTLDCASCISTPRMAASANHPNVSLMMYSEVEKVRRREDGAFDLQVLRKPTFVKPEACTGCAQCETACTVAVPDEFNDGLIARRAAHIPFPQAVPKKSIIQRTGSSPCTHTCPAGVRPSGFVSLVRSGKYAEAFRLHLREAPLVGSLSRACYAPCEGECSRAEMEGPVHIRAIKRFMTDRYYAEHPEPEYGPPDEQLDTKVAIVGSGPAGLTAAYHLAKKGHQVTVFEAEDQAGGMLRFGMPAYRMPKDLLDRDIKNVTALGVEIRTGERVVSATALREQGYGAVLLAAGGQVPRIVPIQGEDLVDVEDCMAFLKGAHAGELPPIEGKDVVVIGGGNVAMDVSRSAVRCGTRSVTVLCLESREAMPAHAFEVVEAEEEGVRMLPGSTVHRIHKTDDGRTVLEYREVEQLRLRPDGGVEGFSTRAGSEKQIPADVVILAVGLAPSTQSFAEELALRGNGTVETDSEMLQTNVPGVFAAGDVVLGPSIIVSAMGQGRRAAFYIDRYLRGESLEGHVFDERLIMAEKELVLARSRGVSHKPAAAVRYRPPHERVQSFETYEEAFTEAEAREAANRCLDCGVCSQCLQCKEACPADAIDFDMRARHETVTARSVVVSTGFKVYDAHEKEALGFGRFPNVINGPQMDRLLAPTRPYNGVLRPSDGREPENIAIVLCTGSRDRAACNPLCCRIGCMYSVKHAQLLMGALPMADVTIYYIDIRAFGKGYDEFYEQARGMGVQFVKGTVAKVEQTDNDDLLVRYEDIEAGTGPKTARHDLVVLATGLQPNAEAPGLFAEGDLPTDAYGFVQEPAEDLDPGRTGLEGVFVAGTASGMLDIPDSILHAGAAATQVATHVERMKAKAR